MIPKPKEAFLDDLKAYLIMVRFTAEAGIIQVQTEVLNLPAEAVRKLAIPADLPGVHQVRA